MQQYLLRRSLSEAATRQAAYLQWYITWNSFMQQDGCFDCIVFKECYFNMYMHIHTHVLWQQPLPHQDHMNLHNWVLPSATQCGRLHLGSQPLHIQTPDGFNMLHHMLPSHTEGTLSEMKTRKMAYIIPKIIKTKFYKWKCLLYLCMIS